MAYSEQYTCDICGKVRGPENHWFIGIPRVAGFAVETWNFTDSIVEGATHYCGLECLTKALAKWTEKAVRDDQ